MARNAKIIQVPYGPFLEEWRDIPGYENRYQASNYGRIKALKRTRVQPKYGATCYYQEKILKLLFTEKNYYQITLWDGLRRKTHRVNRIIAITWIPNNECLPQVNHKDGNKLNNFFKNLEWCTQDYNNKHARINHLNNNFGSGHHTSKITDEDVLEIRRMKSPNNTFKEVGDIFGITPQQAFRIVNKINWKHI